MSAEERPPADATAAGGWIPAACAAAGVASLPFLRPLALGDAFYFRDLSISFLPLHRFLAEGLRAGELRDWVPWVHEGGPVNLPPVGYPVDLLQALSPDETGISRILALHVPFAALSMLCLARRLGAGPLAGFGAGCLYALGGFALSTLNLYFYLHAVAWAPLLVVALLAAADQPRRVAPAAVVIGIGTSTFGAELVLQALVVGWVLALRPWSWHRVRRLTVATALGIGLAAVPLALIAEVADPNSARSAGFPAAVVLSHSVHPLTLLQTLIGSFHGDLDDLTRWWWGQNFFPRGFPYVLSLYLGAVSLAVALVGLRRGRGPRLALALLCAAALLLCLGRWAGLTPLVELLPLRPLRYPVKAFFTVHLGIAALTALGLDALQRSAVGAWRTLLAAALPLGALLVALPSLPFVAPSVLAWFLGGFLPAAAPQDFVRLARATLLGDAAIGGAVVLAAAGLGALALRRRLSGSLAALGVALLIAADVLRTGAGLNPTVAPEFYELSPEMATRLDDLRAGGRTFSCDYQASRAYRARVVALQRLGQPHELLTFAVARETFSHHLGLRDQVATARGIDLTMWVPAARVLSPEAASCADLDAILPALRSSAVGRVLSLDPLVHRALRPLGAVRPRRLAPLSIYIYALEDALPLRELVGASGLVVSERRGSDWIELEVAASGAARLLVREAWAPGWSARLGERSVPLLLEAGRHMAIEVPAGSSRVRLDYAPRSRPFAVGVSMSAAVAVGLVAWASSRRRRRGVAGGG